MLVFFSIIFIIIGLPLYMVGCHDKIGGYCNGFNIHLAKVIKNDCKLTHGHLNHGKTSDDDAIGYNCNVRVEYIKNNNNMTCSIYRSDADDCSYLVIGQSQVKKCQKLNKKDYPINTIHPIYINKVDGRCETHHYVQRYAIIGLVFLILAGVFIILKLLSSSEKNETNETNSYAITNNIELTNNKFINNYQNINSNNIV